MIGYGSKRVESKTFWSSLDHQLKTARLDSAPIREAVAVLKVLVMLRVGKPLDPKTRARAAAVRRDLIPLVKASKGDAAELTKFLLEGVTYYLSSITGDSKQTGDASFELGTQRKTLRRQGKTKGVAALIDQVFPRAPVTEHRATTPAAAIEALAAMVAKAGNDRRATAAVELLKRVETVSLSAAELPPAVGERRRVVERELEEVLRSNSVSAGALYAVLKFTLRGFSARGRNLVAERDLAWADLHAFVSSQYVHDEAAWVFPLVRQLMFPPDTIAAPEGARPFVRALAPIVSHLLPGSLGREIVAIVHSLQVATQKDDALTGPAQKLLDTLKGLQLSDVPAFEVKWVVVSVIQGELGRILGDDKARTAAHRKLEDQRLELGPGSRYDETRGLWSGRPHTGLLPLLDLALGARSVAKAVPAPAPPPPAAKRPDVRAAAVPEEEEETVTHAQPPPLHSVTGALAGRRRLPPRDLLKKVLARLDSSATSADRKKLLGVSRWLEQCPSGVEDLRLIVDQDICVRFDTSDAGSGGYRRSENTVFLSRLRSDAGTVATLVHELTHARLFLAGEVLDITTAGRDEYARGIVREESQTYFHEVLVCRELVHVTRRARLDVWTQFLTEHTLQMWFQLVHGVPYQRRPTGQVLAADAALVGAKLEDWCTEVLPFFERYVEAYYPYERARWDRVHGYLASVPTDLLERSFARLSPDVKRPMKRRARVT